MQTNLVSKRIKIYVLFSDGCLIKIYFEWLSTDMNAKNQKILKTIGKGRLIRVFGPFFDVNYHLVLSAQFYCLIWDSTLKVTPSECFN